MNFAEMFASAAQDNEDEAPSLTAEQQITRLTEYFAQAYAPEPERFEPGQIIWHKNPELADSRSAGDPAIFIGYLAEVIAAADASRDPQDFSGSAATKRYDATMVVLHGNTACQRFIDTRFYTATPPRSR